MSITIGFLNEASDHEYRCAITPEAIKRAQSSAPVELGFLVEKGLGEKAYFSDADFTDAGATVGTREKSLGADIVVFLSTPDAKTLAKLKSPQVAVGLFNSSADRGIAEAFAKKGVLALDLNLLPRTVSMAQSMDAMTSQASVAGYKAVLLAAFKHPSFFPMLSTAAGTVKPASVLVLGAGIAGLQAIGTAKRLGAVVTAFDVRPSSQEEVQSLGAKFLDLGKYGAADVAEALKEGQGEGGYARALTPEELAAQKQATDKAIADFDVVITTASVPGKTPPQFISKAGVKGMKPGSVIIDLAASPKGGNVEGSEAYGEVQVNGVTIIGAPSLASAAPRSASSLLARNFMDTILHFLGEDGTFKVLAEDELSVMSLSSFAPDVKAPDVKALEVKAMEESSPLDTESEAK
jgi:NAD(P) transhydrogenase subunit alpha